MGTLDDGLGDIGQDGTKLKTVSVKVSPYIRQRLRMYAVRLNATMSEAVTELIRSTLDDDGFVINPPPLSSMPGTTEFAYEEKGCPEEMEA